MHVPGLLLLGIEHYRELCEGPNAMELSSKLNQDTCVDTPAGNPLNSMQETKLDDEGNQWIDGKQEKSPISEDVCEKVDSNLAPSNLDTQTMSTLKGELCGLYTQVSIGYVDIFEILREEILAAEARELEVDSLLNASEDFEEFSSVEADERTDVREPTVAATKGYDQKGDAQNCSFHGKATDAGDVALVHGFLQKGEDGQTETPCSPSVGQLEDTTLREGEDRSAENFGAVQLQDNKVGLEDQVNSAKVIEAGVAQDHLVAEDVEHTKPCTTQREGGLAHDHQPGGADEVGHLGLAQDHPGSERVDPVESPSKGTLGQAQQNGNKVDHEETPTPLNRELNGDTLFKKEKEAATDLSYDTQLDRIRGDDDEDHLLLADISDELSEHSDDEEYSRSPFSGPIAFSGMLSYSGLIPYSGQIPHSGNMSLHSDSSTSTRSFAFPILASDWNSSPVKIGQPDGRYFRRRRRWRPRFCCRRPSTLFD